MANREEKADQKNRKRSFRRHHSEDFSRNASGHYEYSGEYRVFAGDEGSFRNLFFKLVALAAAALVLEMLSGLPPYITARQQFHVLVPYAVGIGLTVMLLWKTVRIKGTKGRLRAYVYDETVKLFPGLSLVSSVLFAARCAGVLIDLIGRAVVLAGRDPAGGAAAAAAFGAATTPASLIIILLGGAAGAVCLFLFYSTCRTMRFEGTAGIDTSALT